MNTDTSHKDTFCPYDGNKNKSPTNGIWTNRALNQQQMCLAHSVAISEHEEKLICNIYIYRQTHTCIGQNLQTRMVSD